ncbi:GFA family protein [Streptococcus orisasini]
MSSGLGVKKRFYFYSRAAYKKGRIMISGFCFCQAVTYQVDEEIAELVFCHCSFCRKLLPQHSL